LESWPLNGIGVGVGTGPPGDGIMITCVSTPTTLSPSFAAGTPIATKLLTHRRVQSSRLGKPVVTGRPGKPAAPHGHHAMKQEPDPGDDARAPRALSVVPTLFLGACAAAPPPEPEPPCNGEPPWCDVPRCAGVHRPPPVAEDDTAKDREPLLLDA